MNSDIDVEARLLPSSQELLRDDDSLLRQIFFKLLQSHQPKLANRVDVIYHLSKSWSDDGEIRDFERLEQIITELDPFDRVMVKGLQIERSGIAFR